MTDKAISRVRELLAEHERTYRLSARRWKVGYRALLIGSAASSTSAAVIGKLEHYKLDGANDSAVLLASAAAVITTIIATLDFEVNWRINRKSRHAVSVIALEAEKSTANANKLLSKLQKVVQRRDEDLKKQD